ncbi:MAG: bifunctional adenosylcobinamide kinase/adenosylcobinamide-phosphate guanylyltransferase [Kiritimatiellia bacterium]|jgi:adenosylcobinamide kinase/adenosylcobinamide-phosphate guanylyltransferase
MTRPTVTFVFGGARSGKSSFAEQLAVERFRHPLYLATAQPVDAEMGDRIARHRARRGDAWGCREEPLDLAHALATGDPACDGVLLECLGTWLGNVLHHEGEAAWPARRDALLAALRAPARSVVLVGNETGMGIVPATPLGRRFRDLNGWLNQAVAALADEVVFLAAGLPLWLKRP